MIELIAEKIVLGAVDIAKDILGNRLKEINRRLEDNSKKPKTQVQGNVTTSQREMQQAFERHRKVVEQWASSVKFTGLHRAKAVSQIYVDLDTYLIPMRHHMSQSERVAKPLMAALRESQKHVVILGQAGAGKTTTAKRLCAGYFSNQSALPTQKFPLLIRLRNLTPSANWIEAPLLSAIAQALPLKIDINSDKETPEEWRRQTYSEVYCAFLDQFAPLVILDGFDELPSTELRQVVLAEFKTLCERLSRARLVLTSRVGEYSAEIEQTETFEIAALSETQIAEFSVKWLGDVNKAKQFLQEIDSSPYSDTAIRPLTLAHLCAIYERVGSIPEKPKTVYKKVVGLLIEEWDAQRSIRRPSAYAKFSPDRKFDFLCNLAFYLTAQQRRSVFSDSDIAEAYSAIRHNFGLPETESLKVAAEIESHTGLLVEAGYKSFEFAHKSLQEYLCAEHLVRLPLDLVSMRQHHLPAELAIATALSSNSSSYFAKLVLDELRKEARKDFVAPYLARLLRERPDFSPSAEALIAGLYLLDKVGPNHDLLSILAMIHKVTGLEPLRQYYQVEQHSERTLILKRTSTHNLYSFPTRIDVARVDLVKALGNSVSRKGAV